MFIDFDKKYYLYEVLFKFDVITQEKYLRDPILSLFERISSGFDISEKQIV